MGGNKEHHTQFSNILAWDKVDETWQVVGHLAKARSNQAVMEITFDLYDFCVHTTVTFDQSNLIVNVTQPWGQEQLHVSAQSGNY